jgi:HAE1 family hydrophobic/amphiphilic exporter-1
VTRLGDVARIELAAQDYGVNGYLDSGTAVPLGIFQQPGTNALDTAHRLEAAMAELSKSFPTGIEYRIIYNPTEFIAESVNEVFKTIYEASGLVVIVVCCSCRPGAPDHPDHRHPCL